MPRLCEPGSFVPATPAPDARTRVTPPDPADPAQLEHPDGLADQYQELAEANRARQRQAARTGTDGADLDQAHAELDETSIRGEQLVGPKSFAKLNGKQLFQEWSNRRFELADLQRKLRLGDLSVQPQIDLLQSEIATIRAIARARVAQFRAGPTPTTPGRTLEQLKKDLDYAMLSAAVYDANGTSDLNQVLQEAGWTVVRVVADEKSGFRAALFKNSNTNEQVVAYAGTSATFDREFDKDIVNNMQQGLFGKSRQYMLALGFAAIAMKDFGGVSRFIGHSLGGGLASAAAVVYDIPATTYNAAGLNPKTVEKYGKNLKFVNDLITAHRVQGEFLTTGQDASYTELFTVTGSIIGAIGVIAPDSVGTTHWLSPRSWTQNRISRHSLAASVIPALRELIEQAQYAQILQ